ncbi:hypothetical protein ACB092_11G032900 [Castanea dentata]
MVISEQTDLHLQLQNPNISTMFALLFMLFTTIIAPLIPTLSSLPPPPQPSLNPPPPPTTPAFEFTPIQHFSPFTPSLPDDNIWPAPSQPHFVSVQFVLGFILALIILLSLIAMAIYIFQLYEERKDKDLEKPGLKGEKGEKGPKGDKGDPGPPACQCC